MQLERETGTSHEGPLRDFLGSMQCIPRSSGRRASLEARLDGSCGHRGRKGWRPKAAVWTAGVDRSEGTMEKVEATGLGTH